MYSIHTPQITLDTRHSKHDLIFVLAGNLLASPAPVIVTAKFEDIGGKVVTLENEVFDNDIDHGVLELDTWDRDVANVLEESREDDVGQVLDQMGLELSVTVLVIAKVEEQLVDGLAECLVLRILIELVDIELGLVQNAVGVVPVPLAKEEVALVVDGVPLVV